MAEKGTFLGIFMQTAFLTSRLKEIDFKNWGTQNPDNFPDSGFLIMQNFIKLNKYFKI